MAVQNPSTKGLGPGEIDAAGYIDAESRRDVAPDISGIRDEAGEVPRRSPWCWAAGNFMVLYNGPRDLERGGGVLRYFFNDEDRAAGIFARGLFDNAQAANLAFLNPFIYFYVDGDLSIDCAL